MYLLFKFDVSFFKDYNDINTYLLDKFVILAFQHRILALMLVLCGLSSARWSYVVLGIFRCS